MAKKKKKTFDMDDHIAQMREVIAAEATQQNWRKLCELIDATPEDHVDDLALFVDYAEANLDHWPAELRKPLYKWWQAKENDEELIVHRLVGNFDHHPLLTMEDIERIAPDRKSITAAKKVAVAEKWDKFARGTTALWGEFEGSQDTYNIWLNVRTNALECSCPSRKRPCKHTLGLLMMDASGVDFPDEDASSGHRWASEDRYHGWE